eukprot:comp21244_c0_seq2/m.28938 comp21244_c0_seq2/g.28938  ORF comp21244_c0_seq2/g.28938 comp21244_c0_seq2/m.28938 type:complete len:408 (-) comp21244_c0_seq2:301-1524(-)
MAFRSAVRRTAAAVGRVAAQPARPATRAVHAMAAAATRAAPRAAALPSVAVSSVRGIKNLNFGGTVETVIERSDYPKEKLAQIFAKDTMAVIGYGVQGRAQSLNMRDNGLKVVIGVRKNGPSWKLAQEDGWVPGETLFDMEEAAEKGTVIMYLLSDAGQKHSWDKIKPKLTKGKTLYFSHGFSVVFSDQTGVVPPKDIDVILCAPKGSGTTVRSLFLRGAGINSSYAVYQDVSGSAVDRARALGVAIGSGYLYETDFRKEVMSDLTGERGVLMGAIQGLFLAQYEVLREKGHSPSEAFNETVEEATQSLYPLVAANGMDWMYANCSTTAQRGALDWYPKFYAASKPVFKELYESVETGEETRRTLDRNSQPDHREKLEEELKVIRESEIWQAGKTVRQLRPENQIKN